MVSYHIKVKFEVIGLLIPHALCVRVFVSVCMLVPVSHVSDFSCRNPHGINFVCVCWSLCECTRVEEGSRRLSEVQSSLDILLKHQVAKSRRMCAYAPPLTLWKDLSRLRTLTCLELWLECARAELHCLTLFSSSCSGCNFTWFYNLIPHNVYFISTANAVNELFILRWT